MGGREGRGGKASDGASEGRETVRAGGECENEHEIDGANEGKKSVSAGQLFLKAVVSPTLRTRKSQTDCHEMWRIDSTTRKSTLLESVPARLPILHGIPRAMSKPDTCMGEASWMHHRPGCGTGTAAAASVAPAATVGVVQARCGTSCSRKCWQPFAKISAAVCCEFLRT